MGRSDFVRMITAVRGTQILLPSPQILKKRFAKAVIYLHRDKLQTILSVPEKTNIGARESQPALYATEYFTNKKVIVVGGGDSAMENASFLRKFTKDIIIQIHEKLSASYAMQQRVINDPDITIIYNSTVTEVKGDGNHVTQITITNTQTQKTKSYPAEGVFISIGAKPNTDTVKNFLDLDHYGYINAHADTSLTSLPGIFVAGDVHDYKYKQAVVAAGEGCKAALDVERWLHSQT